MKIDEKDPPRPFEVGFGPKVIMNDCASIELAHNEQVTFVGEDGSEYDVACKNWGYYATPSTNGRLRDFNFRTALVRNRVNRHFVLLVKNDRLGEFETYVEEEGLEIVLWLDDEEALGKL